MGILNEKRCKSLDEVIKITKKEERYDPYESFCIQNAINI
jgi:hypothetical protein